ncbi:MAG: RagB/SusD family nutrient uptake outer membrane protein [Balneolaceae bacterium]|nr:RagB/SusD family nutrient uptake outer membrane protein [Balneolaceae bacterium]
MKKQSLIIFFIGLLIVTISGCEDILNEPVLDESLTGAGRAETVSGAIAPAYGQLAWTWRHTNYFGLQTVAADEGILPYRGGTDWFDGGKFIAVHQHLMTPTNELITDPWNEVTKNISRTVSAIEVLRPLSEDGDAEATGALHEMIALRAYLNMLMLDSWGLVFDKETADETSTILRGQEAVDYLRSELESVVDVINTDKGPGRMTQGAVWGLLARLHLNSAVYRDPYGTPNFTTEDMNKVIEYTDNIINSGNYSLSPEYFDLFNDSNNSNPELIFAIDQRGVLNNEHNRWAYWSLGGDLFPRLEHPSADGTDATAATPDYVQTWADAYGSFDEAAEQDARFFSDELLVPEELQDLSEVDPANDEDHYFCITAEEFEIDKGFLRGYIWGPRKGGDGQFLRCDDGRYRIYPVINERTRGGDLQYVDHTFNVDFSVEGRLHNTGFRYSKYQCSRTSDDCNNFSSVDIVLLRLGEIYLMRAEAKFRNGDTAGALEDLNALRAARNARPDQIPPELTSIDEDILFREIGFELYWEGLRRTNQIRFGKYEDSWTEKTDSDPNKRLFPIPQSAIDGATSAGGDFLTQNPGY